MDRRRKKNKARTRRICCSDGELLLLLLFSCMVMMMMTVSLAAEVCSMEWELIVMSEQEEDLIYRMYKLVGDRWGLIAGRIPGRNAEEIERFWIMRHGQVFAEWRLQWQKQEQHKGKGMFASR